VMKADIGKIMAAVDISRLGAGGELEEHGQNCTLGDPVRDPVGYPSGTPF